MQQRAVYLINDERGSLRLVELHVMPADAEVLGEVAENGADPLIALKDPSAGPHNGWSWPDNMFGGPQVRLSRIQEGWDLIRLA